MRGDIYRLRASRDARGHEQAGGRFGVVVQASELEALSTWLIAPTSTSAHPARWRPEIEVLGRTTLLLCEQTTACAQERLGDLVGRCSLGEMQQVDVALKLALGLT
ncbi:MULTISPECIES: type II toxin-antitoxin system PemK/MazF family toxin [unclassified Crossiella]|uniref:type II toxin-antitoxin system PemK/MazF family toxin n=1 Tax=unclassified Crossiella TaxID=2620835 RepID=UPI001FFF33F3|nr:MULTISPECIES: type II toxin-antitoxin system PemK/MazF family toxin [unclassified Crossiella]MCK2245325.1 type II toxin-antitoxin system PemK/MazF family toxin [Crossiella sp. S99.2]MCK2258973.1 type II toxin-antitoxin system PemK/MazF family toxin [Crossiella sp. S99.1]